MTAGFPHPHQNLGRMAKDPGRLHADDQQSPPQNVSGRNREFGLVDGEALIRSVNWPCVPDLPRAWHNGSHGVPCATGGLNPSYGP